MQDMHVLEREKLQNEMLEKIDKTTRKIAPTPNSQTDDTGGETLPVRLSSLDTAGVFRECVFKILECTKKLF
jgi:hypothetical protein